MAVPRDRDRDGADGKRADGVPEHAFRERQPSDNGANAERHEADGHVRAHDVTDSDAWRASKRSRDAGSKLLGFGAGE